MPRRSSVASRARTSAPSMSTVPDVGSTSRLIVRTSVLLPQPDGPSSTANSPAPIVRSTSWTAGNAAFGYCTASARSSTRAPPPPPSGETVLLEEVTRHVGRLAFLRSVDLQVEVLHHVVGQQRRQLVERWRDGRFRVEHRFAHDCCDLVRWEQVLVVLEHDEVVRLEVAFGREREDHVDVAVVERLVLQAVVDDLDLRSEEHTSELQSRQYLVCRLLLEKKK